MPPQPPSSPAPLRLAQQTAEIEEARLRTLASHEEAVLIDSAAGSVIWRKEGEAASVSFTDTEITQMRGQVLTHNHSRGWGFPADDPRRAGSSFSVADIAMLVEGHLAEIRAISPRYLHTLRPPSPSNQSSAANYYRNQISVLSYDEIVYQVRQYETIIRQRNYPRIMDQNDPLTREQASAHLWHEVMGMVASGWGVEYERKEWTP